MNIKYQLIFGLSLLSVSNLASADCYQAYKSCNNTCTITSIGLGLLTFKHDNGKTGLDTAEQCLKTCETAKEQCVQEEHAAVDQERKVREAQAEEERRKKEQAEREAQSKLAAQQPQQAQFTNNQSNYTMKNGKVLVNAGNCSFYSKTPPAGRVKWNGPCSKGLANGEGITRYYTAENKIFSIAKDKYQSGKYKSTKEAFFMNDGKVMHKTNAPGKELAEEVPPSAVPDWAKEVTGEEPTLDEAYQEEIQLASKSSKKSKTALNKMPMRGAFEFYMNFSDGHKMPMTRYIFGKGEQEMQKLAQINAEFICKYGTFECKSVSDLYLTTCEGYGFVLEAKIALRESYEWYATCFDNEKSLVENFPTVKKEIQEYLTKKYGNSIKYDIHEIEVAYVNTESVPDEQKVRSEVRKLEEMHVSNHNWVLGVPPNYTFSCDKEREAFKRKIGSSVNVEFNANEIEPCLRRIESEARARFGIR